MDPVAAARWARSAPPVSPWLHEEVARRMEERLQWIKLQPAAWADWEATRGGLAAHGLLEQRYPAAQRYVIESNEPRLQKARQCIETPWWQPRHWTRAPARYEVPPEGSVQMLWANMGLHTSADPQALMAQWQRALAANGFLMFSCLGPDSLRELRELYAALGWPPPGHAFTDMHDWGDMLVQAGFAEPVMDMERLTLSFATPRRLLQELRELGRNLHPARFPALRGRRWREQLERELAQRLPRAADGASLSLSFEIIYGHALKAPPRLRMSAQSAVSLQDMQALLKGPRPRR
jgi:malonyl-CoA O-methyltransferase